MQFFCEKLIKLYFDTSWENPGSVTGKRPFPEPKCLRFHVFIKKEAKLLVDTSHVCEILDPPLSIYFLSFKLSFFFEEPKSSYHKCLKLAER